MKTYRKLFYLVCSMVLIFAIASLCGCGPSRKYWKMKEEGYYPTAKDFPSTRWVCREADMYFDMLEYDEDYWVGEYTVADKTYRVIARTEFSTLDFQFISSTNVSTSKYSDDSGSAFVNCETVDFGKIITDYVYEDGIITCEIKNDSSDVWNYKGNTITFEKEKKIAQEKNERWYCQEIDMYLESYNDIDGYYKGVMTIDNKKCGIQAFEIGNDNYYMFSLENGVINNLREGTSSALVCMFFEYEDGKIIGKITDKHISNSETYHYWTYKGTTLTFTRER